MKKLHQLFDIAGGSITGTKHTALSKNNEDSYYWLVHPDAIIGIVCDGCSNTKGDSWQQNELILERSDVGSGLLSAMLARTIYSYVHTIKDPSLFGLRQVWHEIRADILSKLRILAHDIDINYRRALRQYFECTVVGVLILPEYTYTFACGDGIVIVNGEQFTLGPFPGNQPPYLVYNIIGVDSYPADQLELRIIKSIPTSDVSSILIGTDGVIDLTKVADSMIPGQTETVGSINRFWEEDIVFSNPAYIRNRLASINTTRQQIIWKEETVRKEKGLLPDDTTMIVIRKHKTSEP